jgi:hypothetical protein
MRRLLATLFLLSAALLIVPAHAQDPGVLYDNGLPCPGYCHDAWQISGIYFVTDSLVVNTNVKVTGFDFWTWEYPGDRVLRVQWTISSDPFGGTVYASGLTLTHDMLLGLNEYGFDIDKVTVNGLAVDLPPGTYWITLQHATDALHDPVYWDENSGEDCHSPGCPSSAFDNQVGTIPSESFDIRGEQRPGSDDQKNSSPTSGLFWGPVLIGMAATLRRFVG